MIWPSGKVPEPQAASGRAGRPAMRRPASSTAAGASLNRVARPCSACASSSASPGIGLPATRMTSGTARMTPSLSGWPLTRPWPSATSSSSGMRRSRPASCRRRRWQRPEIRRVDRQLASPSRTPSLAPARASTTGTAPITRANTASIGGQARHLVAAGGAQLGVELGESSGLTPVGFGKQHVEADDRRSCAAICSASRAR